MRFRFNHIHSSLMPSLERVCRREWPGQKLYDIDKREWSLRFAGGGKWWLGGLDDAERADKVLGQEHSTIYLNECSQISYRAFTRTLTRLRQSAGLPLKHVCDENPPLAGHWTQKLFALGVDPDTGKRLEPRKRQKHAHRMMHPANNPYTGEDYKESLREMSPRDRIRFWDGEFGAAVASALWTDDGLELVRLVTDDDKPAPPPEELVAVSVAVDPSGCHGPDDKRSDEVGIVVCGRGVSGKVYVLEDASGRMGPSGVDGWAAVACRMHRKWDADHVVAETNYGGAMVRATLGVIDPNVPVREVVASRGKVARAEPVAQLFAQGRAFLCGHFPELEAQLVQFSSAGYCGDRSPDRADAMVWGMTDLGVTRTAWQGFAEANAVAARALRPGAPDTTAVILRAPAHILGTLYQAADGKAYAIADGCVTAQRRDIETLQDAGFVPA